MKKAKIPPELLQKIKDAVNIIEVVGEHVVLRKTGSNHVGLCPFHAERSPSFSVNENKQLYHCYGCKKGGDLISFVMEVHGISFPEAIEDLAERARIALPKDWAGAESSDDPEVQKRKAAEREKTALAFKMNRFVAAYYHQMLNQAQDVQTYFRKRGVNDELMGAFHLGFAPAAWDSLALHLDAKKAPLLVAGELGLIRPSTKGGGKIGFFDLFRNRAMFPILDMRRRVAGFGGRMLPWAEAEGNEGPKYMNSPESSIFHKSKIAYGLYQAQTHIREKNEVILVEGYFDVLALHAAGFRNVVATCGTALTPDHLAIFRRFADKVTILFDSDKAGIAATEKAMELGLDHGMVLYGATLPPEKDPDEILFDQATGMKLEQGTEQMAALLAAAQPLLDARIESAVQYAEKGPEARTQALKKIAGWLGRFKDPVGQAVRIEALHQKGFPRTLLGSAIGSSTPRGQSQSQGAPQKTSGPNGSAASGPFQPRKEAAQIRSGKSLDTQGKKHYKATKADLILLIGIARGGVYLKQILDSHERLPPESTPVEVFEYPPVAEVARRLLEHSASGSKSVPRPEDILEGIIDPQVRSTLTEAMVSTEALFPDDEFRHALDRAIARSWARFSQRIKGLLADAEAKKDARLHEQLMKDYLDVQRKMKEFNSFYDEA